MRAKLKQTINLVTETIKRQDVCGYRLCLLGEGWQTNALK